MELITFKETLKKDIIQAMKDKNTIKLTTLRSISTAITNAEKSGKTFNVIDILSMLAKQRQQSIEQYINADKKELADIEQTELDYIKVYLPSEISETELTQIITDFLNSYDGEKSIQKDMGKVMGFIKTNYPGQNMKLVGDITKSLI
jgi:uncharacterized protein